MSSQTIPGREQWRLGCKNIDKKIINNTLININQANKFLNTELKFVAWKTLVPTFPSIALVHSFLYTPIPPISVKRIITSNIFVEKKLTLFPNEL